MDYKDIIVEYCTLFAHADLMEKYASESDFQVEEDGELVYTETAQQEFNELYDYYYHLLDQMARRMYNNFKIDCE